MPATCTAHFMSVFIQYGLFNDDLIFKDYTASNDRTLANIELGKTWKATMAVLSTLPTLC
jgi:hypothetical protein